MSNPLRPDLYNRLVDCFGKVIIADEGVEMREQIDEEWVIPKKGHRAVVQRSLRVIAAGEYYRVACRYCTDTRHRLWINHRWGLWDERVRSNNLFLAHCFNEDCLAVSGRARELWGLVAASQVSMTNDKLLKGERPEPLRKAELPGDFHSLHTLAADHPAVLYLRGRGYGADWLSRDLGVGFTPAHNRIIVPLVFGDEMVGWQGRYVGTPPDKDTPKYFTMKGAKKKQILYNYDVAAKSPFVVVCEGVTDVWSFGREAVAIFGKKISGTQTQLIASTWGHGTVVILLDGEATDEAQEIFDALGTSVRNKVIVTLPADKDPGDYPSPELRRLVYDRDRQEAVELRMVDIGPPS